MSPDDMSLVEKLVIMDCLLQQKQMIITALLSRCGGEAKIERAEFEFTNKSYDIDENVSSVGNSMTQVYMRLKLKD